MKVIKYPKLDGGRGLEMGLLKPPKGVGVKLNACKSHQSLLKSYTTTIHYRKKYILFAIFPYIQSTNNTEVFFIIRLMISKIEMLTEIEELKVGF